MNKLCRVLALAYALFILGCASVSINSVKDPAFSGSLHKMFIVVNHVQVDRYDSGYTNYLITALKDEFASRGLQTELRLVNPLSLDEHVYQAEIAFLKPDGVLTIVGNGETISRGGLSDIFYDVSLFDPGSNRRIWRAQLRASGGTAIREKRMKIMAQVLVQQLSEDRLIN